MTVNKYLDTMPGKCKFKDAWLENEAYKDWLLRDSKDEHKARCSLCTKTFEIASMGESALRSHVKSKKKLLYFVFISAAFCEDFPFTQTVTVFDKIQSYYFSTKY